MPGRGVGAFTPSVSTPRIDGPRGYEWPNKMAFAEDDALVWWLHRQGTTVAEFVAIAFFHSDYPIKGGIVGTRSLLCILYGLACFARVQ